MARFNTVQWAGLVARRGFNPRNILELPSYSNRLRNRFLSSGHPISRWLLRSEQEEGIALLDSRLISDIVGLCRDMALLR